MWNRSGTIMSLALCFTFRPHVENSYVNSCILETADFVLFDPVLGPVSRKSRELFGPEKLVVKLQSACFEKLIFLHVFNIRKIKRIAKFEGLEPRRCEDTKGIVAPERDPKSFGTFEKQAPALWQTDPVTPVSPGDRKRSDFM